MGANLVMFIKIMVMSTGQFANVHDHHHDYRQIWQCWHTSWWWLWKQASSKGGGEFADVDVQQLNWVEDNRKVIVIIFITVVIIIIIVVISISRWKRSSSMSLRCDPWIECWKWIKTKTTQFRSNCYQKNAKNHLTNIWLIIKILTKQGQSGTWLVGLGWILRRSIKKDFLLSGSGTMFYGGGAIKTGPRRQPLV